MDEKTASRKKSLELAEISPQTVHQFPAKSHRKLVWLSQQNRNAELKLSKIVQFWIY